MKKLIVLLVLGFCIQVGAQPQETTLSDTTNWNDFKSFVESKQHQDEVLGRSYMISGALAALGGAIGFQQSEEIFSRTIFAVTSNLGLAAIGLGATYYWTGNDYESFYYALEGSSLNLKQKNELLGRFLQRQKAEEERKKWIRVATHSLIALVNLYSASHEENGSARSIFYFLGGANLVLAGVYSF